MKNIITWISPAYWLGILIYYLGNFMWGSLGVIRPSDIQDGKIDAEYTSGLVANFSGQFSALYAFVCLGFILSVIVNLILKKMKV